MGKNTARCTICGNENLTHNSFDYYGNLLSDMQYCDQCFEITEWEQGEDNYQVDYADLRENISLEEKEANYPGQFNEMLQKEGSDQTVKTLAKITRVGGEDYNPKHRVELNFKEITGIGEGYFSKKDCLHVAAIDWFEKAKETGIDTLTLTNPNNTLNKAIKEVPFKDKLNELKEAGIITKFIPKDEAFKIHAAYADMKKCNGSINEIKERYF